MILDGGPTTGGIESTVLDLTTDPPRLLRPGLVTPAMIEEVIGRISRSGEPGTTVLGGAGTPGTVVPDLPVRSPGMMLKRRSVRAARKNLVFSSSLSRRSVERVQISMAFSDAPTIDGATELEKRYGRER